MSRLRSIWTGHPVRALATLLAGLAATPQGALAQQQRGPLADDPNAALTPPLSATNRPATARPFAAFSASASSLRDSLVTLARAQVGRRYRTGGESPDGGFDCSGLVQYVMATLKVQLPRTAKLQAHTGRAVPRQADELRPGDLVTFGSERRVSHIGIYVGDGRFVHASTKAGKVIESKLERPAHPLIKKWQGARRIIATEDTVAISAPAPVRRAGPAPVRAAAGQ